MVMKESEVATTKDFSVLALLGVANHTVTADQMIEVNNYAGAEIELRKAVRITEEHLGNDHPSLVSLLYDLGLVCHVRDKYGEAEAALRRAVQIGKKRMGRSHPEVTEAERALADLSL